MGQAWLFGSNEFPTVPSQLLADTPVGDGTVFPLSWTRDEMIENEWRWKRLTLSAAGTLQVTIPILGVNQTEVWSIDLENTPNPGSDWDVLVPDEMLAGGRVFSLGGTAALFDYGDDFVQVAVRAGCEISGLFRRFDGDYAKSVFASVGAFATFSSFSVFDDVIRTPPDSFGPPPEPDGNFSIVGSVVGVGRQFYVGDPFPGELAGASITLVANSFTVRVADLFAAPAPLG